MRSDLDNNQLSGTIPSSLGSLTLLWYMCEPRRPSAAQLLIALTGYVRSDLSGNQLSGTIPSSLGNMTALQSLCVLCSPPFNLAELMISPVRGVRAVFSATISSLALSH